MLYCFVDSSLGGLPLLVVEFLDIGLRCHVGQTQQCAEPVGGLGNTGLCGDVLYLAVVVLHEGRVDGCGVDSRILFYPDSEVDFTPDDGLGDGAAYLHLFLTIERSNACRQVEGLAVQRFDFNIDFLFLVGYDSLAVAGHRQYHSCYSVKFLQKYEKTGKKQ